MDWRPLKSVQNIMEVFRGMMAPPEAKLLNSKSNRLSVLSA